jgi:4-hydroxy 2-oxovalerate aldolase
MSEATGKPIQIHDPSLRDGHHAVRHSLAAEQLRAYALAADAAGVPVVEVGHGNGLGASRSAGPGSATTRCCRSPGTP